MIKEKSLPLLTNIVVVIALLFTLLLIIWSSSNSGTYSEPNYISTLFNKDVVIKLNIEVDETEWAGLIKNATAEEFIPCNITINGDVLNTVGIRAKGNSSLSQVASDPETDRFSFKIDFSEYVGGQNYDGLTNLALNNLISDPTYMKEYLSYEMMTEMGVNSPAYAFADITVNGEPWGFYLAVEVLDEDFLERTYGSDYENLYKPEGSEMGGGVKPGGEMTSGGGMRPGGEMTSGGGVRPGGEMASGGGMRPGGEMASGGGMRPGGEMASGGGMRPGGDTKGANLVYTDDDIDSYSAIFDNAITKNTDKSDYNTVIEMIKNLSEGTDLEEYLDVDEILRYFAVNTFLVNLDSYAGSMKHNYYLYEEEGKFQILPWDFNLSFGAFQMGQADKIINFPIDAPVTDTMENSPLIAKLLEVGSYKSLYHSYLQELVDNYINTGTYDALIDKTNALISDYVKNDASAFYTFSEYETSITQLKVYAAERAESITLQLAGEQPSDSYGTLETTLDTSALGSMGGGAPK